jgi:hypothetical protein
MTKDAKRKAYRSPYALGSGMYVTREDLQWTRINIPDQTCTAQDLRFLIAQLVKEAEHLEKEEASI